MAHDPTWPDKAMFAALLLIVGGGLGLALEGLRAVATVEEKLPEVLAAAYPHWLSAVMAAATVVFGILSLRTQGAVFGYLGAATGLGSLAYAGLVPVLSLLAIAMLIKSRMEGEETRNDGITLHPALWPDKAMAASLFIVISATISLVQGVAIARGDYEPLALGNTLGMIVDFIVAAFLLVAGYQVYMLKTPWMGTAAAIISFLTFGMYVLGPAMGITIYVLIRLAHRENEFTHQAPTVTLTTKTPVRGGRATATATVGKATKSRAKR